MFNLSSLRNLKNLRIFNLTFPEDQLMDLAQLTLVFGGNHPPLAQITHFSMYFDRLFIFGGVSAIVLNLIRRWFPNLEQLELSTVPVSTLGCIWLSCQHLQKIKLYIRDENAFWLDPELTGYSRSWCKMMRKILNEDNESNEVPLDSRQRSIMDLNSK
jgi:hypothetical protein